MRLNHLLLQKLKNHYEKWIILLFSSSKIFSKLIPLLVQLISFKYIAGEDIGLFNGLIVYLSYIMYVPLGVINGLSREIPILTSKNKTFQIESYSSTTNVSVFVSSILFSIFFIYKICYAYISLNNYEIKFYITFFFLSIFHLYIKHFFPALYRTSEDFVSLSKVNFIIGLAYLFQIPLIYFYNIDGLLISSVLLAVVEYCVYKNFLPIRFYFKFNFIHFKDLIKIGNKIFWVGQVNILFISLLSTYVFNSYDSSVFSFFSFGLLLYRGLFVIHESFGQIAYTKMGILYGHGYTIKKIINEIKSIFFFLLLIISLITVILFFSIEILVGLINPNYLPEITLFKYFLCIPLLNTFSLFFGIFNVTGKLKFYFVSLLTGTLISLVYLNLKYDPMNLDLEIYPKAMIVGFLVQQVLGIYFIKFRLIEK